MRRLLNAIEYARQPPELTLLAKQEDREVQKRVDPFRRRSIRMTPVPSRRSIDERVLDRIGRRSIEATFGANALQKLMVKSKSSNDISGRNETRG